VSGGSPHTKEVFVAQKRVIRAMAGIRFWKGLEPVESCRPLFKDLKILPVFSLYVLVCAKFVKKYPGKFTTVKDNPNCRVYSTRNTTADESDICVLPVALNVTAQSPMVMIARIYNHWPSELKQIESEELFVCSLKNLLSEKTFMTSTSFFSTNFDC
jgi:hypothetical protein